MRKYTGLLFSLILMLQPVGISAQAFETASVAQSELLNNEGSQEQDYAKNQQVPQEGMLEEEAGMPAEDETAGDLNGDILDENIQDEGTADEDESEAPSNPDSDESMDSGSLLYGWQGDHFYSLQDGSLLKGWLIWNQERYYFDDQGLVRNQSRMIDGKMYRFDEQGRLILGHYYDQAQSAHQFYSLMDGQALQGIRFYDNQLYLANQNPAQGLMNYNGKEIYSKGNGQIASNEAIRIGDDLYYFEADGFKAYGKYAIVDGQRYYFSDTDGKGTLVLQNEAEYANSLAARAVIEQVGADLFAVFNWVVDTFTYRKDIFTRQMDEYAQIGFRDHQGNCFTYASCFYYLAKELGYTARYVHGLVKFYTGAQSEHGWVMIREGDKEYIYDTEAEDEIGKGVYHFFRVDPLNPIIGYRFPAGEEPLGGMTYLYDLQED